MIRVLHAVSIMNRAGQETFLMNVYRNIDRNKIQFDFQCSVEGKGDFDDEIHSLGGNLLFLGEVKRRGKFMKYIEELRVHADFFKRHSEYDVYHIHTYHAFNAWINIVGAKFGGMKKIVLHSHNTSGMHPTLHKVFRFFLKFMKIERCACSALAAQWMYGKQEKRVSVIQNGIWPEKFLYDRCKSQEMKEVLGLKEKLVFGHVGRFMTQKNHKFLIEIFAKIKQKQENAVLLLVGAGGLEGEIKEQIKLLGLEEDVLFLGIRKDVDKLLQAMDIFLLPSLFEGLPVVAVEAQAAGTYLFLSDTITPETKITSRVRFLPLKESAKFWSEEILKEANTQKANIDPVNILEAFTQKRFTIEATTEDLTTLYSRLKRGLLHE